MDPQLRKQLTEEAYYAAPTGISHAGDSTFGSPTLFMCRTELRSRLHGPNFIPRHGEDVETFILVFTLTDVPLGARIWLPGKNTAVVAESRKMFDKETVRDERGNISHYEIRI